MGEIGYYEKRPRPEHRKFIVEGLRKRSSVVTNVDEIDDFRFVVARRGMSPIRAYLTNKYILSVADTMEILEASPETTCIVSTMNYNQISMEAARYCVSQGVAIMKSVDLLRAVFHDGSEFLDFVPTGDG